jgi:hypothetical protein
LFAALQLIMTKVQTVIVNHTQVELVLRVGSQNCSAELARIVVGGEHKIELDVNWTYQEFSLVPKGLAVKKIILDSDDCCDYERITVTISGGTLQLDKVARGQINADHPGDHLANWKFYFNWRPTWPKFNWRFWPKLN